MELNRVLDTIRRLINKAESLEASGDPSQANEAIACRERADEMMQRYAVEEWQTIRAAPSTKPTRIRVDIGEGDSPFLQEIATLVNVVGRFCKCSSVWMVRSGRAGDQEYVWVYGYESDLRYFEMLFTTLHIHMLGAIFPKPDPAKSEAQNIYELHNAGLNWFDSSKAYGWYKVESEAWEAVNMYVNRNTGERLSWSKSIGRIKDLYNKEVARRGERPLRIPPSGSETFRKNAAQGYLNRINQRLRRIADGRGTGAELVLANKEHNIADAIAEAFPNAKHTASKSIPFNQTAYSKGVEHANTANLNPSATTGNRNELAGS